MLERYAKQISNLSDSLPIHESWKSPSRASNGNEVLLHTANWGQGAPYNSECPEVNGIQAPTGCVATAMAIVMDYNKWPNTYDWEAMEANPANSATLMKDAGEAVRMNYGERESGADINWAGHMLHQEFLYSPDCQ